MKFIDIDSFRAEIYFSSVSPLTSTFNEMSADEIIAYMSSEISYFKCEQTCNRIRRAILKIAESGSTIKNIIPQNILDLGRPSSMMNPERLDLLLPFFEWLKKLQADNQRMRECAKAEIHNAASHLDRDFADYIESLSEMQITHRIKILNDENGNVGVKSFGRLWGNAGFRAVDADFTGLTPSFGTAEWFEAEFSEGVFEFRFLINEELSSKAGNILNGNKLNEVTITAKELEFSKSTNNYIRAITMSGNASAKICEEILIELACKANTLGMASLDTAEKTILPLAQLASAVNIDSGKKIKLLSSNFSEIFRIIENNFAFTNAINVLKKSESESVKGFVKALMDVRDNFDMDEPDVGIAYIKHAFRYFNMFFAPHSAGRFELSQCILGYLDALNYQSHNSSEYLIGFDYVVDSFKNDLEAELNSHGFSGNYPNYVMEDGKFRNLITVNSDIHMSAPRSGCYQYTFSISLAKVRRSDREIPKTANASDLYNADCKYSHIATKEDGGELQFVKNLYTDNKKMNDIYKMSSMPQYVDTAVCALKGRKIPKSYAKNNLLKLHKYSGFRAVLNFLPFLIIAATVALIFSMDDFNTINERAKLLFFVLCGSFMCVSFVYIIEKIRDLFSIWKI